MHRCVLLLFILGFGQSIYAVSIYQLPDLTRRLPERTSSPGCAYKGERYDHGERVPTEEPCLNCTCIRAVLVCYLRVCPTPSAPPPGCFAAREVGECCPTLVCGGFGSSPKPSNVSDSSLDLRPIFQPDQPEVTADGSSTVVDYTTDKSASTHDIYTDANESTHVSEPDTTKNVDEFSETTQTFASNPTDALPTVSNTPFHSTLTEDDSLVYISSTQEPSPDYDMNFYNDIPGGCLVNGTLYGDGSAMLSSTFCEYCFCIRGKSTCLKPKCQLSIDGCIPQYDSRYSCCPSRYDCSQNSVPDESIVSKDAVVASTTPASTTEYLDNSRNCIVDGTVYHQGEVVPNRKPCHNCYCSDSSVECEKVKCAPAIEGCQPIIPNGHCCPVSYRCDYQTGHSDSNSIKGSNLNDSVVSVDGKGTDIKSVKNYYISNNGDTRLKIPNDRESIALLRNVIPAHKRLDSRYEQNSTIKSTDEISPIYIGYGASTKTEGNSDNALDHIRENDKNLDLNDTVVTDFYSAEERTVGEVIETSNNTTVPHDATSSTETVFVGSPEVHTLSILDLIDQFFGRRNVNASKLPDEAALEPKRNNSKQPSSIVEIDDVDVVPQSTTMKTSTASLQTTGDNSKISNENVTVNTEIESPKTTLFDSSSKAPISTDSDFENASKETSASTGFSHDKSVSNEKTENQFLTLLFPSTEAQSAENFQTRTDAESSYPIFVSTLKTENEGVNDEANTHTTLEPLTTSDDLDGQDILETSSTSEILTTIEDFFNLKFNSFPLSHSTFASAGNLYNDKQKKTPLTSSIYPTDKTTLIEELESETQTRPVVLIYDPTRNSYGEKTKPHAVTQSGSVLYDSTRQTFADEWKKDSEIPLTSILYETTKPVLSDDSERQTDTKSSYPLYATTRHLYNEHQNLGESPSLSPVYTSTEIQNSEDQTETTLSPLHFSSITKDINNQGSIETRPSEHFITSPKNVNTEDQTEASPSLIHIFTNKYINNEDQTESLLPAVQSSTTKNINNKNETEIQSYDLHSSTINQYVSEPNKHTLIPFLPSTYINSEDEGNKFITLTDHKILSEISKILNQEGFPSKPEIQQTYPIYSTTDRNNNDEYKERTLQTTPRTKPLVTTRDSEFEKLNDDEKQSRVQEYASTVKEQHKDNSMTTVVPTTEINTQKYSVTTESSKVSTRINSKLPSFNYASKTDDQNNSYSRYPVLTDSVVNVYLKGNGSNRGPTQNDDFRNVGSIYLGAPISVGETDSRKEIDHGKPKITHSGGVIFMDPKYTDLDGKNDFQNPETIQGDTVTTDSQELTTHDRTDKDSNNSERKKEPRNQDAYNQSNAGQSYKIIPFVAEDAVRGQFGKINNTHVVQPGATELPDMVSDFCFIKGRIYMNGEMIGKPDPCELCRCFYGRELCQIQRCPAPPDCIPEKVPGFCCPRFTCGNNGTSNQQVSKEVKPVNHVHVPITLTSTRQPVNIERKPPTNDRQEMKFGIRVRARPTQVPPIRATERTTEMKIMPVKITTAKPEIRTLASKPSVTTTTSKKPTVVHPITSKTPEIKRTTTTTTMSTTTTSSTTTHSPIFPDPWGLLKVSGCNIYGKFFNINDQVEILSGPCSHCICTINGVECNDIC